MRAVVVAAILGFALAGPGAAVAPGGGNRAGAPPPTAYVAHLRSVAAQVGASANEIAALPARSEKNTATLLAAGRRLATATGAARDILRAYRAATTRYGTAEEWQLAQHMLADLTAARTTFAKRAGVTLATPTRAQRSQARGYFDAALTEVANEQIAKWTGDTGLADVLTGGSLSTLDTRLRQELETRLRANAQQAITNATGLSLSLGVPLKQQVRSQVDRLASNWLARAVLHVGPQSLVVQLAGRPIVNWIGARLQAALRHTGNPVGRAESTMAQLSRWRSQMLLLSPTSSLRTARGLADRVDRELSRSGFLKLDLRRAGKLETLAQLERAESLTRTSLALLRARFLLDSPMARADLNALVDQAKRILADVEQVNRKLTEPVPIPSIGGTWTSDSGGVYEIRQSGKNVTWIGHSPDAPDAGGKVSWYHRFTGTIRDGRYIVGSYADVPSKSRTVLSGPLVVEIVSSKELRKVAGHGGVNSFPGFGDSVWTR